MADTGVLGIGLACEPRQAATALEAAVVELRKLAEEPVGDAELTKAREYAKGRLLLAARKHVGPLRVRRSAAVAPGEDRRTR